VWADARNNMKGDIYGYDLETHTEFPICTVTYAGEWGPAISGNIVVWIDSRYPDTDLFGYNLETHTEFPICVDANNQLNPAVDGNVVVWEVLDENQYFTGIYGYDLETNVEFPVFIGEESDHGFLPAISQNIVVFGYGDPGDPRRIYCSDITDECTLPLSLTQVIELIANYGTTELSTGINQSSCASNDTFDVWRTFVPANGGTITISTDGSDFDTTLSVFNACGGDELACNDDYSLHNTQSRVTLDVVKGKTYFIRIAGFNEQKGDYQLLITGGDCVGSIQGDINDDCIVNYLDFAIMCNNWLECNLDPPEACWP
jgi:beta propeller repeat protein